ncbi:MAG: glycoside hydrolase family 3 N-terminal domain-containing protein [Balneolaceae bacterium]|nr:glycoside hydrolase family 3 N-terminal domain-containing protein [Balneolaceae bacterium]
MKKLLLTILFLGATVFNSFAQLTEEQIAQKVDSVMQTMTLTDKVGEMTQLAIDMVSTPGGEPENLNEENLRNVLLNHRVGSILNVAGHAYTLDEWHSVIRQIQEMAVNEKPTGIPVIYGIDSIHGANYTMGSTLFPQQIGMAATWNTDLIQEGSRISAYETRASWIPWNFSPVLDIGRNPEWPRFWETFGEDVHLASEMGVAMVKGFQGEDVSNPYRVAATAKHFLGYSLPASGHDRTVAWIPEIQLREHVLPTFEAAFDAGAHTVMINSGEINGIPVHANEEILTDLLRDELGFKGIAVSDWADIIYLHDRHKITKDYKESIKVAINAGVDMSMVPLDLEFPRLLKELVEEGEVPMSRINESVRRILRVKFLLGLFDQPYHPDVDYSKFASDEHAEASYQTAVESITLLKNENDILPLDKNSNVLVTGPTANSLIYLNGGWSRTWQGDDPQYDTPGKKTILDAIRDEIGEGNVNYVEGTSIHEAIDIDAAVQAAQNSDVAVIAIGEKSYTETPGDLSDMHLPEAQRELVKQVAATETPVVLVLVEGRPRIINDIVPEADGVLMAYLPAHEGGRAVSDILFGDQNPSGHLPFTYPSDSNDLVPYDHNYTDEVGPLGFNPEWEFGTGLSYTTFDYSNLSVSSSAFGPNDELEISVDITNSGERAGKDVVQLYVSDLVASITPPVKRLRGFEKVDLEPGETQTVSFSITADDLAFIGKEHQWITEKGEFKIQVDDLEQTVTYQK